MPEGRIAAVLIHVADQEAGLDWYSQAFPQAQRRVVEGFTLLDVGGISLEIVPADAKVSSGAAGTVVYWHTDNFAAELNRLQALGAVLYRGPMAIEEGQQMAQVKDPWGNLLGLRG
ncbi:VOC family protein [Deinococcus radiophilus]|uniref:Glyoxalase/bleomycin resistance/dioxygenase family protein n=1 Tax=Deinococcus radiophilus TaxID=32062 RepID=A0A3S0L3G1_9DEIO|nr:VOC family protein [Deinococcus radiophilus]RTR26100.1 glyoxalase/bleomycin resistance/dioxygenase family protein [Deinococcus radiophilus]UFA51578.1 glyoxalase/bleomycin resistance/dioxygenase family protein [Deinococcus radiophilus]